MHPGGVIPMERWFIFAKIPANQLQRRNFLIKKHLWNELWEIVGADVLIVACRYNKFRLSILSGKNFFYLPCYELFEIWDKYLKKKEKKRILSFDLDDFFSLFQSRSLPRFYFDQQIYWINFSSIDSCSFSLN